MAEGIVVRPARPEEAAAYLAVKDVAFHVPAPERAHDRVAASIRWERTRAAFDGDLVVGTSEARGWTMTYPGGELPVAAITGVTVLPTHRRRGVLRAMMAALLADARERGEAAAVLTASEGTIYRRFGFGPAVRAARRRMRSDLPLALRPAGDDVATPPARLAAPGTLADELPALRAVHDEVRRTRPGVMSRDERWWARLLRDEPQDRDGHGPLRLAVVDGAGYVLWRIRGGDDDHPLSAPGVVEVRELLTTTPGGARALLGLLASIDLTHRVDLGDRPLDDDLDLLAADPRALLATDVFDHTWMRILDVPRVLAGRTWAAPVDVVLELRDPDPAVAGQWHLRAAPDGPTCARTDAAPGLVVDAADLAALLLGDGRARALCDVGLATEREPGAASRLDVALRLPRGPWTIDLY